MRTMADQYHLGLGSTDYQNRSLLRRISEFFYKPSQPLLAGQYLLGVDIWDGQGIMDFPALEAGGVSVAFIRLNNMAGGHHPDEMFNNYWNAPTNVIKIPYFVYNPWVTGQANYDYLAAHMPANAKAVMIDIEVKMTGYAPATYAAQVEIFKNLVKTKWNTIIYTAEWFLSNLSYWPTDVVYHWAQYPSTLYTAMTITWDRMRELLIPLSTPSNAARCPGTVKVWQCSADRIVLPGSANRMDVNVIYMSLPELQQFAGVTVENPGPAIKHLLQVYDDGSLVIDGNTHP